MTIYEKNMAVIERTNKALYKGLIEKQENKEYSPQVEVREEKALNGEPILVINKAGEEYRLNSLYNPTHEAQIWSEQYKAEHLLNVFILFGLGSGYFVRALKERIKEKFVIIIYEPSYDIFDFVIHHYDITDILEHENIGVVVHEVNELSLMNTLIYVVQWDNLQGQRLCLCNGYHRPFRVEFVRVYNRFKDNNDKIITNHNTAARFGVSSTYNAIENSKYMYNSYNLLNFKGRIPKDVPAIVVAAGPSLEKNVDQLKKAKGKALIIAVDRALDILIAHDIMPDFSITIDADKEPRFYDNPITWEIPLLYPLTANRKIVSRHTGKKILFYYDPINHEYYNRLGEEYFLDNIGGSVATAAFTVAQGLGCENIILIGQDLAYANGYTHAGGVKLRDEIKETDLAKVKGINGEELYTGWDMYGYIVWYQDRIENIKGKVNVIDATEGGALIRGTQIMTFEEAINEYCKGEFNVDQLLEETAVTDTEKRYEIFLKLWDDIIEGLKELEKNSKKAVRLCTDLLANVIQHTGLSNKGVQMSNELSELNTDMNRSFVNEIVESFSYSQNADKVPDMNKLENEEIADQRKTFEMAMDVYEVNERVCKELLEYMEPFVERLPKKM